MTNARWLAVIVTASLVAVGCGSNSDCNLTPEVNQAPSSCTLEAGAPVTVNVRWCSCGASTTCDVSFDASSGIFQLEPKVSSCDASCPANPTSCPFDSVSCSFTMPASGSGYSLYVVDGLNPPRSVPLNLGGSQRTCGS